MVRRQTKPEDSDKSFCPLTSKPRLRLASDTQTASIKDHFPKGIAQPALRALYAAGFTALEQLATISEDELLALHGMGPNAVQKLREGLNAAGLGFRGAESDCGIPKN